MSAVAGAVTMDGRPVTGRDLAAVMAVLAPLGPDGCGTWAGTAGPMGVAIGAVCRRRVPHDEMDVQPVSVAGGQVLVVADVVLHNREELCRELGMADAVELTDSEIVARAYMSWGRRCCGHLRGEFAFAVVDRRAGGVLLARDHTGVRPLHMYRGRGWVGFASTALAVTGFEGVPADIDVERLKEYLALIMVSERSWFRDVVPVPPATALWITPERIEQERYWCLEVGRSRGRDFGEHVEEVLDVLDDAVRVRLRRRGGIGIMLSGGLDSTAVAASVALQVGAEPVRTYTSVPPEGWAGPATTGSDPDESRLVYALADWYPNLRPLLIDVRGQSILSEDDALYELGAAPCRNPINRMWIRAAHRRASMDGVGVLFSGAFGNAGFSLDGRRWLVELLGAGRFRQASSEAYAWSRASGMSMAGVVARFGLLELTPPLARRLVNRARGRETAGQRALRTCGLRPRWWTDIDLERTPFSSDIRSEGHGLTLTAPSRIASQSQMRAAMEALWGHRRVDPTEDWRLLQVCASQPAWVQRRRGSDRAIARAAMRGRVPDQIRLRRARGAQLPDWLDRVTDARADFCREVAAAIDHALAREFIDVERLADLVGKWPLPDQAGTAGVVQQYRLMLPRALAASHYLHWFDAWSARRADSAKSSPAGDCRFVQVGDGIQGQRNSSCG